MQLLGLRGIVFLASFLLFQIELVFAKALLPGFGGSYLVWGVCVTFFQGLLFLGYAYFHGIGRFFGIKNSFRLQVLLIVFPLLFFPLDLASLTRPAYSMPFFMEISWLLARNIGLAFFALSTVSVSCQSLLSTSDLAERSNPYILYGTSNLGSMVGLLSYPFVIEPLIELDTQVSIWCAGYVLLALLHVPFLFVHFRDEKQSLNGESSSRQAPSKYNSIDLSRWFLFAAAGSAMCLAVTNIITFDLPAGPFFWVIPLAIYLLTFIVSFKCRPWRPRWIENAFYVSIPIGAFLFINSHLFYPLPAALQFFLHLVMLFLVCMVCHGSLSRQKPAAPGDLTGFYFALSAGGFAGSMLVSWIIPLVSSAPIEYLVGFLLTCVAFSVGFRQRRVARSAYLLALALIPVLCGWVFGVSHFTCRYVVLVITMAAVVCLAMIFLALKRQPRPTAFALFLILAFIPFSHMLQDDRSEVCTLRNFYGVYRVYDYQGKRSLRHGTVLHGSQFLDPKKERMPLMYYHPTTPVGEVMATRSFNFETIGIVGLGTGSLASYLRPGQNVDFYELDPDNGVLAEEYFSYLRNSLGHITLVFGDARTSLRKAPDKHYDLLILDAFSSDSIPVHLITVEAIAEYLRCLKPGGIVLFHISNDYLDLKRVLFGNAQQLNLIALYKSNIENIHPDSNYTEFVALTADSSAVSRFVSQLRWKDLATMLDVHYAYVWTDSHTNLFSALLAKLL